jgi:hypothetical protein
MLAASPETVLRNNQGLIGVPIRRILCEQGGDFDFISSGINAGRDPRPSLYLRMPSLPITVL